MMNRQIGVREGKKQQRKNKKKVSDRLDTFFQTESSFNFPNFYITMRTNLVLICHKILLSLKNSYLSRYIHETS